MTLWAASFGGCCSPVHHCAHLGIRLQLEEFKKKKQQQQQAKGNKPDAGKVSGCGESLCVGILLLSGYCWAVELDCCMCAHAVFHH
jgi:hypothetical protein